jgi:hypothetical protein
MKSVTVGGTQLTVTLVARVRKLCTAAPNYSRHSYLQFFPLHRKTYQSTCIEQKATDNSEVHGLFLNCGSAVWHLHHFALLAPRILR